MNISSLQIKAMAFDIVSVNPTTASKNEFLSAENFDFSGVKIICEVGYGDISQEHDSAPFTYMMVSLHTRVENKEGRTCPYDLNVRVNGVFHWLDTGVAPEKRQDLIVVNGASLLFGAVREMVSTVTARSVCGALLLPCLTFHDNAPSLHKDESFEVSQDNSTGKRHLKKLASDQPKE